MRRHGVEVFPSLVEAARSQREMSWRLADEKRAQTNSGGNDPLPPSERADIHRLLVDGESVAGIARQTRRCEPVVREIRSTLTAEENEVRAAAVKRRQRMQAMERAKAALREKGVGL